jgi:hypothetical protein
MPAIQLICPVCERDIEIPERDLQLAFKHKAESGDRAMASCPKCCRALEINGGGLPGNIDSWLPDIDDMFCFPFLEDTVARNPAGYEVEGGIIYYRPGGGGSLLPKREYMFKYGIDPECSLKR